MNANEMSYEFDVLYDRVASAGSPGYTDKEKSVFLTKAELVLIDRYAPREYTERRRRDFANITSSVDITTQSLPSDFMYAESEEVTISSSNTCFDSSRIMVLPKREDEYVLVHTI
jgi:hypothetical protein